MSNVTSKYVKLGVNASSFFAPATRFKVKPGDVLALPAGYNRDGVIMAAISGGHLVMASEAEAKEFEAKSKKSSTIVGKNNGSDKAIKELEAQLGETTQNLLEANDALSKAVEYNQELEKRTETQNKAIELLEAGKTNIFKFEEAELDSYLNETYDLSKDDKKAYNKMSFEEKQAYAYDLEKNSDEAEEEVS